MSAARAGAQPTRRRCLALLAGAAAAPMAARAQRQADPPLVAVLDWEAPAADREAPFRQEMRALGHVEGATVAIEYAFTEGRAERVRALAAAFAARPAAVIVAVGTPAAHLAREAARTIPLVAAGGDPLGAGLVLDLDRPGGNVTGVATTSRALDSERLELLRALVPGLGRVAFLGSSADPAPVGFLRESRLAAARAGLAFVSSMVADADQIDEAMAEMARDGVGAVVIQDLLAPAPAPAATVAAAALRHRLPTAAGTAHLPRAGGLMSYGPEPDFARRRAAHLVDRILRGASPGTLAIEQPAKPELVVNLGTARALGLDVPASLRTRADAAIE